MTPVAPLKEKDLVVLVCGGREYTDQTSAFYCLDLLHSKRVIVKIISGAARGADTLGIEWAKARGIPFDAKPADWKKHGKAAGPIRNQEMLDMNPDYVVAFPGGRGTAHMVKISTAAGKPVWRPYG